jgi:hypothetical protein
VTVSNLDLWMTAHIGANWKTSVTGISNELCAFGVTASVLAAVVTPEHKTAAAIVAVALAVPRTVAGILNALVAADASATAAATAAAIETKQDAPK